MKESPTIEFILYVKEQDSSKKFYSAVLELKPVLDVPGMTEFLLAENVKLGLMPENGIAKILTGMPHPKEGSGIPRCELYLYVNDVQKMTDRALSSGAKLISAAEKRNWGDYVSYLSDPDGHVIAFASK